MVRGGGGYAGIYRKSVFRATEVAHFPKRGGMDMSRTVKVELHDGREFTFYDVERIGGTQYTTVIYGFNDDELARFDKGDIRNLMPIESEE